MNTCADSEKCGRPQIGPGHPRAGWLNVKTAGTKGSTWWCSAQCLITALCGDGVTARPDIGRCLLCINRHDRDHRCGVCNTRPQLVHPAPRPIRLFNHAQRDLAGTNTSKETA